MLAAHSTANWRTTGQRRQQHQQQPVLAVAATGRIRPPISGSPSSSGIAPSTTSGANTLAAAVEAKQPQALAPHRCPLGPVRSSRSATSICQPPHNKRSFSIDNGCNASKSRANTIHAAATSEQAAHEITFVFLLFFVNVPFIFMLFFLCRTKKCNLKLREKLD